MRVLYVVDGYNFLFRLQDGPRKKSSLEERRKGFIETMNTLAEVTHMAIVLVFDGAATPLRRHHYNAIEIVYTEKGESADAYILERARKGVAIVTSDRDLRRLCKAEGASTQSVEEFLELLEKKSRKHRAARPSLPSNDKMVAYYLEVFTRTESAPKGTHLPKHVPPKGSGTD